MKFLVDAQLPKRLVALMRHAGYDVLHTSDLPAHNRTTDQVIVAIADQEDRVVVTKDADFVDSFILHGRPNRLLVITTGNISNTDLELLVAPALPAIVAAFTTHRYVELSRTALVIHQ